MFFIAFALIVSPANAALLQDFWIRVLIGSEPFLLAILSWVCLKMRAAQKKRYEGQVEKEDTQDDRIKQLVEEALKHADGLRREVRELPANGADSSQRRPGLDAESGRNNTHDVLQLPEEVSELDAAYQSHKGPL